MARTLRIGSRLDKYRLLRRLGCGGFATVYSAMDQIENRHVALKIPEQKYVSNASSLEDLQREVRIMARLQHNHILQLKDARFIDGRFVMVFPLGEESLDDRLHRRMARHTAVQYAAQMIDAVAFAHSNKVLHRDIKPDNFILFSGNQVRLTDFGLARIQTGRGNQSASGTLGYMAPEQAMGHPTFRSDVFALGLVLYRLLAGELPAYPFDAPLPGFNKLRRGLSPDLVALIRKSIDPIPSRRFRDAVAMQNAFKEIRNPLSAQTTARTTSASGKKSSRQRKAA
ncbi:MAG: serine/threonine-protein kinase [Planctomycetaceae bacterium]